MPQSSGLAGSTALLASTLACVLAARGEPTDLSTPECRLLFSELVRDVELKDAGIVCGYQDAYMVVHGGLQLMDFSGKHPTGGGPCGVLKSLQAELPFLLITTGVERLSGSVHGPMVERWLSGENGVIEKMKRTGQLGFLGAAALEHGDLHSLAEIMEENQAITASLGGSGEAIDLVIHDAKACGAVAAKLSGAGMGGTVIALTADPQGLEDELRARGYTRFLRPSIEPGLRFEEAVQ